MNAQGNSLFPHCSLLLRLGPEAVIGDRISIVCVCVCVCVCVRLFRFASKTAADFDDVFCILDQLGAAQHVANVIFRYDNKHGRYGPKCPLKRTFQAISLVFS